MLVGLGFCAVAPVLCTTAARPLSQEGAASPREAVPAARMPAPVALVVAPARGVGTPSARDPDEIQP